MMPNGSYSLGEAARTRAMLRLACPACGRRGQYRIDRLLECYPADIALPDLRHELGRPFHIYRSITTPVVLERA